MSSLALCLSLWLLCLSPSLSPFLPDWLPISTSLFGVGMIVFKFCKCWGLTVEENLYAEIGKINIYLLIYIIFPCILIYMYNIWYYYRYSIIIYFLKFLLRKRKLQVLSCSVCNSNELSFSFHFKHFWDPNRTFAMCDYGSKNSCLFLLFNAFEKFHPPLQPWHFSVCFDWLAWNFF